MKEKRFRGAERQNGIVILFILILLTLITCEKPERILKFETLEAEETDITFNSALLKGEITDPGSKAIEQHGLLLSESSVPAIGQQNTVEKPLGTISKKGQFEAQFTGLKASTTYYFRAFVVVDGTPEAGSIKQFQTPLSQAPEVTAGSVTGITMTAASLNGEVTSDGGEPGTVRGLCWGLSANPTVSGALDTTKNGTGAGTFIGIMTGLTPGTLYYARTYARNSKGTSYNNADLIFKTHNLPVVTTAPVTGITETGASTGGEVTDAGGVTVSVRGVCWSTTTGPTTALTTKTDNGTGEGQFTSTITGLTSGTKYYVRAYATNQYGTSYGAELSFYASTTILPPSATTGSATPVGTTSATLNGIVNASGLSTTVTFEYGLTSSYGQTINAAQNPVTGNTATSVSASVTGLSPATTYHFRVKAESTGGIDYGEDVTFNTTSSLPAVNDFDGNTYNIITIGTQEWLQLNLKTEHYNNGDPVTKVTDDVTWGSTVTGAICYYNNDEASYKSAYGGMYNWFAVTDVRNICPVGWHVPSDAEWSDLTTFLGGDNVAGGKLKEAGVANWTSPNSGATNETGFTAYPTGYRAYTGVYGYMGQYGYWWTTTEGTASDAWYNFMSYGDEAVSKLSGSYNYGFAVRCVKGTLPIVLTSAATSPTSSTVTVNGKVNPNNASTTITFEYGLTTSYGSTATATQSPASGFIPVNVSANLTGLSGSTTYHYRVKAVNSGGTVYGKDMTFITGSGAVAASVTTGSATAATSSGATLHGTVNANNYNAVVTFEYGPTTSYGTEVTAAESPVTGTTETAVSASITGLSAATTYHFRVKAVNAGGTSYGSDATFSTSAALPTVTDYDGNIYNIVTIGTQEWMQSNLRVTHYSDGQAISNTTDNTTWAGLTAGAYVWYNNDQSTYKDVYGALYNGYVATDWRNACPVGWHVPTDAEFTTLSTYLGGESIAGGKLKEAGLTHWITPNTGATNETGFTALPAGEREADGNNFSAIGYSNFLWSATPWDANYSWARFFANNQESVARSYYNKKYGYSIRCIKGEIPLVETYGTLQITSTSAKVNGIVNPNGAITTVTFEYGTSSAYGMTAIAKESPMPGSGWGTVTADFTGLLPGTVYHYRIKAENTGGIAYGNEISFITLPTVSDADGNVYNAVSIGSQTWMQENLKTRKYNDNTSIPEVTNATTWSGLSTAAYCWYNNDKSTYGDVYGALYNWYAVNTGKLCPVGWHAPTDAEWITLITNLGGETVAGGKLKETGISHWASPNTGATNETSFTALPSGYRGIDGIFASIWEIDYLWTTTNGILGAWSRYIRYDNQSVGKYDSVKRNGFSVRCLKD